MVSAQQAPERVTIRKAADSDVDAICALIAEAVEKGATYPFSQNSSESTLRDYFFKTPGATYVASIGQEIVGVCFIRPNQPGRGAHVANSGFVVRHSRQRQGIGRQLTIHCINEARRQGYKALCFNFVVSTNTAAIGLWKSLGFEIVGKLPGAFNDKNQGLVDCFVMWREL